MGVIFTCVFLILNPNLIVCFFICLFVYATGNCLADIMCRNLEGIRPLYRAGVIDLVVIHSSSIFFFLVLESDD